MAASAEHRLAPILRRLALAFALVAGIGLPCGYFGLQYSNQVKHVEITAQLKAQGLTAQVTANPELWVYQLQRVEELLLRYPPPLVDDLAIIRDAAGNPLITVGVPPHAPVLVRSSPVYDSGRMVAQVEITHSYREVVYGTLVAGLLGFALGALVYATLLVLPLRVLRRMSVALEAEQAALRAHEDRFRTLFDRASDGIIILSPVGKLVAVNESFARMHGYSVKEMLNVSLKDLDVSEPLGLTRERLQSGYSGESLFFEVEHYHKDGHVFRLEVSTSLIVSDGETLIQAFHRDITARKRAEQENIRQLDELRRWQALMLGREDRNMELKREVNELLRRLGEPIRYPSQEGEGEP